MSRLTCGALGMGRAKIPVHTCKDERQHQGVIAFMVSSRHVGRGWKVDHARLHLPKRGAPQTPEA